jgi:hypothetical protein
MRRLVRYKRKNEDRTTRLDEGNNRDWRLSWRLEMRERGLSRGQRKVEVDEK